MLLGKHIASGEMDLLFMDHSVACDTIRHWIQKTAQAIDLIKVPP